MFNKLKNNTNTYYSNGNPLGHDFTIKDPSSGFLATSATCTEAATYYYKCSRCGASSKGNTNTTYSNGNPLGHTATTWESDLNQHWQICTRCGAEFNRGNHIDANKDGKCDTCQRSLTVTITFDANGGTIDGASTKHIPGLSNHNKHLQHRQEKIISSLNGKTGPAQFL